MKTGLSFCRHCDDFWVWPVAVLRRGSRVRFFRIGPRRRRPEGSNFLAWRAKNPVKEIP